MMTLRHALDDHGRAGGRFPGERRTLTGRFSGADDRLIHVDTDGAVRDFSYPLSGLGGVTRSRFGVAFTQETGPDGVRPAGDTEIHWFDGGDQSYVTDTSTVIETTHTVDGRVVRQRDATDGRLHHTRFETGTPARLYGYVEFAPDRTECQRALLHHDDAVEVYHRTEHDYLAIGGEATLVGEIPETVAELSDDKPTIHPTDRPPGRYEDRALTGGVVVSAPTTDGIVGLATLLTDASATGREAALDNVRAAAARATDGVPADAPLDSGTTTDSQLTRVLARDLRVLRLLSAPDGGRIAGPDFDPLYVSSGGYGYTWFRDDAEIAQFLLTADDRAVTAESYRTFHDRAVAFYAATQRPDGAWPHRVWPEDGSLAPGWANARLEAGDDGDYQADQTASVVSFLATYLRIGDPATPDRLREALATAVPALTDSLAADGLPVACQNAWENMQGRFAHTAFTFLRAFAALERVANDPGLTDRVPELGDRAAAAIDSLLTGLDRLWLPTERRYGLRVTPDDDTRRRTDPAVDSRADAASLAAPAAFTEVAATRTLDTERVDQLVAHVDNTVARLYRETDAIRGLVRFEGDDWRRDGQSNPKVWTVSTAWGAHASAELGALLANRGDDRVAAHDAQARILLGELLPGGSLRDDGGYLPEQFFDDGTPDSARPLGWPHALRTATATALARRDALHGPGELVKRTWAK